MTRKFSLLILGLLTLSLAVVLIAGPVLAEVKSGPTELRQSVIAALKYNPQLKVLQNNRDAVVHEKNRARGGYFPSLDLAAGYGAESHNDEATRARNEDESEWDERLEASLRLTQLIYDGWETSSRVGVEDARLESAKYRVLDNAESVALDAVIAHLEVYRQRELVALAEQNERDHQDYLAMLEERQRAGAGNIADVSQAQGRLALARSSLAEARSELNQAVANYQRVVGTQPGNVAYMAVDSTMIPVGVDEAVTWTETGNPKVLALGEGIVEAKKKIKLANSNFHPKVNLELSTSYEDKVESSETYEQNNQAMVRLRWNLFSGGSDIANRKAFISRKYQAVSARDDQMVSVVEETRSTWAKYVAARNRTQFFNNAVEYNEQTLDAYLKQFNVAQRTLLDVLDARNELFQSSGRLVTAKVNEVIAVMRLNALGGNLNNALKIQPETYQHSH